MALKLFQTKHKENYEETWKTPAVETFNMWQENNAILATSNNNQSDRFIYFYTPPWKNLDKI
jgi:hypothetical protein